MEQDRQLREQLRRKEREAHDAADPRLLRLRSDTNEEHLALDDSRAGSADDGAPKKPGKPALTADQVKGYQETFEKIRAATGVESMEALVENFQDIEQKNFSLFNSINELNSDIETSDPRGEIDRFARRRSFDRASLATHGRPPRRLCARLTSRNSRSISTRHRARHGAHDRNPL